MLSIEVSSICLILSMTRCFVLAIESKQAMAHHDNTEKTRISPTMTTILHGHRQTVAVVPLLGEDFEAKTDARKLGIKPSTAQPISGLKTPCLKLAKTPEKRAEPTRSLLYFESNRSRNHAARYEHTATIMISRYDSSSEHESTVSVAPSQAATVSKTSFSLASNSTISQSTKAKSGKDCGKNGEKACDTYVTRWVEFYVNVGGWIMLAVVLVGITTLVVTHILAKRRTKDVQELPLLLYKEITRRRNRWV